MRLPRIRGPFLGLPLKGYTGITLYPWILISTSSPELLRHELLHWWEIDEGAAWSLPWRWCRFYATWLFQRASRGYDAIDAERRAYAGERDPTKLPRHLEELVAHGRPNRTD